ncbi:MAG: SOS response-associated peptidase [Bacteroidetes bacterium]|nr:SOS response-associated peptidase [Bacteroidota bacterium]
MCGRSSITKSQKELEERFGATFYSDEILKYDPNYNAAPSQNLPVITNEDSDLIQLYRWGLIPFWSKDKSISYKMINARAETLMEKPSYKTLIKRKRCLVLADGFYEWMKKDGGKIPYRVTMKDENAFAFAGLWDVWNKEETIYSFTIITLKPNKMMANIHDRMPAILLPEEEKLWIDPELSGDDAMKLLNPYPDDAMKAYPVSKLVNSPGNNEPDILKPDPDPELVSFGV